MTDAYAKTDDDGTAVVRARAGTKSKKQKLAATSKMTVEDLRKKVNSAVRLGEAERINMRTRRDFIDGNQWTEQEEKDFRAMGQSPVVINKCAPKTATRIGSCVRAITEPEALPKKPSQQTAAEALTDAFRYVADEEDLDEKYADCVDTFHVEGIAAIHVGIKVCAPASDADDAANTDDEVLPNLPGAKEPANDNEEVEITAAFIDQERFIRDPHSKDRHFKDAGFLGIANWDYLDRAKDRWSKPDQIAALERAVDNSFEYWNAYKDEPRDWWGDAGENKRVRVMELYWLEGGRWWVAFFTHSDWIIPPRPTGYLDKWGRDECPIIATSCFVARSGERYSALEWMLDAQREYNKRRSSGLRSSLTNQLLYEDWAVPDVNHARDQLGRAGGAVKFNRGALTGGLNGGTQPAVQIRSGLEQAQAQVQFLQIAGAELNDTGPDIATAAQDTSQLSGISRQAQQQYASLQDERPSQTLRTFRRNIYRAIANRIRQFWTKEKWVRVRDDKQGMRWVRLNGSMTRLERLQELLEDKVPIQDAVTMLGDVDLVLKAAPIVGMANQQAQQQAQAAAQQGMQVPPEMVAHLVNREVVAQVQTWPEMQATITENDLHDVDADVYLADAADNATILQQQFDKLAELAAKGIPIPMDLLIESSSLRNKQEIAERMQQQMQAQQQAGAPQAPPPDPGQQALVAANIRKTNAQADQASATAQATLAGIPHMQAQAQNIAVKTSIEAQHAPIKAHKDLADAEHTRVLTEAEKVGMSRTHADTLRTAAEAGMQAQGLPQQPGGPLR